jgi:phage-related protein
MPAGQIIGRISVKVLPDTDSFRKEAKVKLAAIEKGLKFVVPTTLDITGAKRDLLTVLRELNAENKTMNSRKIRLYAQISTDGMRGELAKYRREATAMAKTNPVKIKAELVAANATLELDKDSLKHVKQQIEHWRRGIDPLKISVKLEYGSVSAMAVSARLAILSRDRFATIIPRVSKTALAKVTTLLSALSGARMLRSTWDNIWNMFKNLDKVIPLIALVGNAIGLLGASVLSASSNIFALASSLASIAAVGLVLPGIMMGFAIGLGITLLALKGVKKFMPDLYKEWTAFKDLATKDFWSTAGKGIHELAHLYLPELGNTAKVVGRFWGTFASALSKPFKLALGPMFDNLNKAVKISADNAGTFANIVTQLGLAGSSYLPSLSLWFNRVATTFDNFLKRASADGTLKAWVDTGIAALHDLGRVLSGTFNVLADLGRAAKAAGGSTLGILADSLAALHKVTSGPVFQKGMADAFRAAHQAIQLIVDKSGPAVSKFFTTFSATLTTLLPIIGSTIGTALDALAKAMSQPAFQTGLTAVFAGIQKGIEALAPAMPSMGIAFGKLMEVVGTLATNFGPLLAGFLQGLTDLFLALAPAITPLIPILTNALLTVIQTLAPALVAVVKALAPTFPTVVAALADAVVKLAPSLPGLATALGDLLIALTPLLPKIVDLAVDLVPVVIQVVDLTIQFAPLITTIMDLVVNVLPLLELGLKAQVWAMGLIVGALSTLLNAFTTVFGAFLEVNASAAEALKLPWAPAVRAVSDKFNTMAAQAKANMAGIATGAAVSGVATGANFAAGLNANMPAVNAAGRSVAFGVTFPLSHIGAYDIGVGVAQGLANGILVRKVAAINAATLTAQATANAMRIAFNSHSPSRVTMEIGRNVGEGLIVGMESTYDAIRKSLAGLGKDIASTTIQAPTVQLAGVSTNGVSGGLSAAYGAAGGASGPMGSGINVTVPMMPTNSTPEDVADALLFAVRRITHGGVYAQA